MGLADAYQAYMQNLQQQAIPSQPAYFIGKSLLQTPLPQSDNPWANAATQFIQGLVGAGLQSYGYNQGMSQAAEQMAPIASQMFLPDGGINDAGLSELATDPKTAMFFKMPVIEYQMQKQQARAAANDQVNSVILQAMAKDPRQGARLASLVNGIDMQTGKLISFKPETLPMQSPGITLASDGVGGMGGMPTLASQTNVTYEAGLAAGMDPDMAKQQAEAESKVQMELVADAIKKSNEEAAGAQQKLRIGNEMIATAANVGEGYNTTGTSITDPLVSLFSPLSTGIATRSAAREKADALVEESGLTRKPSGSGAMSDPEQAAYTRMAGAGIRGKQGLEDAGRLLKADAEAAMQKAQFLQQYAPTLGAPKANALWAAYVAENPSLVADTKAGKMVENKAKRDLATWAAKAMSSPTIGAAPRVASPSAGAPQVKQAAISSGQAQQAVEARSEKILAEILARGGI